MTLIAGWMRKVALWRFRQRGLSSILEIPDATFLDIVSALEADGWEVYSRYWGMDAGIDHDCVRLRRHGVKLKCEWDRCDDWRMEGPKATIQQLAERFGLTAPPP
jgi:hypothetical protein